MWYLNYNFTWSYLPNNVFERLLDAYFILHIYASWSWLGHVDEQTNNRSSLLNLHFEM